MVDTSHYKHPKNTENPLTFDGTMNGADIALAGATNLWGVGEVVAVVGQAATTTIQLGGDAILGESGKKITANLAINGLSLGADFIPCGGDLLIPARIALAAGEQLTGGAVKVVKTGLDIGRSQMIGHAVNGVADTAVAASDAVRTGASERGGHYINQSVVVADAAPVHSSSFPGKGVNTPGRSIDNG